MRHHSSRGDSKSHCQSKGHRIKLASPFDQHVGFQNVRLARSGPEGDGGGASISKIDTLEQLCVLMFNVVDLGVKIWQQ